MAQITLPVGRGTSTGIDPSLTDRLQESVGVVYEPGDPAAHKFPGREVFNDTTLGAFGVDDVLTSGSRIFAFANGDLYKSNASSASFTNIHTFPAAAIRLDIASLNNVDYVVSEVQTPTTTPVGAIAIGSNSDYRMGLHPATLPASAVAGVAGNVNGTVYYWVTEYDSTNLVESAAFFSVIGIPATAAAQKVTITKSATINATADKWRVYRTIDGGLPPIGWLVEEVAIATTTCLDNLLDSDLVLNDPYRIVTINGIPESMDEDPQELALSSIASFQGSLIGTTNVGGDLAFTPAQEPHSWPSSYKIIFPTQYRGQSVCVRKCGDVAYVAFPHELFMVNYLPDENDAIFSPDIAVEHVANFGTFSHTGMCVFTGWGGQPVLFVASLAGPILVSGKTVDRAVANIDWAGTINLADVTFWKAIDNPAKWRVELYYRETEDDGTTWKVLHFYYDQARVTSTGGPLPEMCWTGPHPVPGPGGYAINGNNQNTMLFTAGSNAATGTVYLEDQGTSDAALVTDSVGTIPFRLRTNRLYPGGIDGEARADRLFIHKADGDGPDYEVTFNSHRENGQDTAYPLTISGEHSGVSSHSLNVACVSLDIEINADGVDGMAPINNITVRLEDAGKSKKTEIV